MKYSYYPGCSLKASCRSYEEALMGVCKTIGVELEELKDWNCCGATAVPSVSKVLTLSLAGRNLSFAAKRGNDVMTPCPACWLGLNKANDAFESKGAAATKAREAMAAGGYVYDGGVRVRHLLDILANDVGPEKLRAAVKRPLTGVKIAPYYGCQLVRPKSAGDDELEPHNLERIIEALGAEVASFPMKTSCCGGSLVATREEVARHLSWSILESVHAARADVIATACPLCMVGLEVVQARGVERPEGLADTPILSIAQLIAMAMGLERSTTGIDRCLIPFEYPRPEGVVPHA